MVAISTSALRQTLSVRQEVIDSPVKEGIQGRELWPNYNDLRLHT
jgi:hypothetical protein